MWDPIPRTPEDQASSTWLASVPPAEGNANAWAPLAVDEGRALLFAQTVEATGGGRGLASGKLYTRHGELAATCVQEGLMRWVSADRA